MGQRLQQAIHKRRCPMANKDIKSFLASSVTGDIRIKLQWDITAHPLKRVTLLFRSDHCRWAGKQQALSCTAGGDSQALGTSTSCTGTWEHWQFPLKVNMYLHHALQLPLLSTCLRWTFAHVYKKLHIRRSTMVSLITAPNCKPPTIHELEIA